MNGCKTPCQGCTTTCQNLASVQRDARTDQTPPRGTVRPKP